MRAEADLEALQVFFSRSGLQLQAVLRPHSCCIQNQSGRVDAAQSVGIIHPVCSCKLNVLLLLRRVWFLQQQQRQRDLEALHAPAAAAEPAAGTALHFTVSYLSMTLRFDRVSTAFLARQCVCLCGAAAAAGSSARRVVPGGVAEDLAFEAPQFRARINPSCLPTPVSTACSCAQIRRHGIPTASLTPRPTASRRRVGELAPCRRLRLAIGPRPDPSAEGAPPPFSETHS